eukprot:TRINITY_DN10248_c0_g1_i2.p1 TRINITY_DN10248_c0_g1~~TRINITY_DN10248_c0_g1_i2.p1  ORF type:complete len:460 (+),score=92.95 TRINITY_DN10248_c0_g1_i2:55-1434(+)
MHFFFFKQKTAYEMLRSLVGSEMCIRDRSKVKIGMSKGARAVELVNHTSNCDGHRSMPGSTRRKSSVQKERVSELSSTLSRTKSEGQKKTPQKKKKEQKSGGKADKRETERAPAGVQLHTCRLRSLRRDHTSLAQTSPPTAAPGAPFSSRMGGRARSSPTNESGVHGGSGRAATRSSLKSSHANRSAPAMPERERSQLESANVSGVFDQDGIVYRGSATTESLDMRDSLVQDDKCDAAGDDALDFHKFVGEPESDDQRKEDAFDDSDNDDEDVDFAQDLSVVLGQGQMFQECDESDDGSELFEDEFFEEEGSAQEQFFETAGSPDQDELAVIRVLLFGGDKDPCFVTRISEALPGMFPSKQCIVSHSSDNQSWKEVCQAVQDSDVALPVLDLDFISSDVCSDKLFLCKDVGTPIIPLLQSWSDTEGFRVPPLLNMVLSKANRIPATQSTVPMHTPTSAL